MARNNAEFERLPNGVNTQKKGFKMAATGVDIRRTDLLESRRRNLTCTHENPHKKLSTMDAGRQTLLTPNVMHGGIQFAPQTPNLVDTTKGLYLPESQ